MTQTELDRQMGVVDGVYTVKCDEACRGCDLAEKWEVFCIDVDLRKKTAGGP